MENEARRKREETEQKPGWQEARIYDGMFHQKNEPYASKVLATRTLLERRRGKSENHLVDLNKNWNGETLKDDGVNMNEEI